MYYQEIKFLNCRRSFGSSAVMMNEDPVKLAQLKEAPLKSLEDVLTSGEKHDGLITVSNKVTYPLQLFLA